MLVLTRKVGEKIVIGDNIRLTVAAIYGNRVQLALTAPAETIILRAELCGRCDRSGEQTLLSSDSPGEQAHPG